MVTSPLDVEHHNIAYGFLLRNDNAGPVGRPRDPARMDCDWKSAKFPQRLMSARVDDPDGGGGVSHDFTLVCPESAHQL